MTLEALLSDLQALQKRVTLDKRHVYRVDGAHAPGVTTVIKIMDAPQLDAWKVRVQVEGTARAAWRNPPPQLSWADEEHRLAAEVEYVDGLVKLAKQEYEHERQANEAADVGKAVHALIEHEIRMQLGQPSEAPTATDEALFTFAGWKEWAKRVRLEPLIAEAKVWHPLGFCGTLDLLALVNGKPAVLDWKPQATVYPERRLQSAAYREALHSMGWPPLDGYIVSMPRDGGEIEMVPLETGEDLAATFAAFSACLSLYRWKREIEKAGRAVKEVA